MMTPMHSTSTNGPDSGAPNDADADAARSSTPSDRQVFETDEFRWIDFTNPTAADIEQLDSEFHFHPLDLEDVMRERQRPKLVQHTSYLFLEIHVPVFDPESRRTRLSFLDFFVTHTHVITAHREPLPELESFKEDFDAARFPVGQEHKTGHFFASLLEHMYKSNMQKLDHVAKKLGDVEDLVFEDREREVVEELLYIKRDLISFRRILRPQRTLLDPLFRSGVTFFPDDVQQRLEQTVLHVHQTYDLLDNLFEMSTSLDRTTNEILQHKVNQKMKLITFLSTMLFPLSVGLTLIRMDLPGNPFIDVPNMYAIAIAVAGLFLAIGLIYFRKKDLL